MPFFLARKRTSTVPRGTQQLNTEYERTPPSAFRYYPYAILNMAFMLMTRFLAASFVLANHRFASIKAAYIEPNFKTTFWQLEKKNMLPFNNPDAAIAFPRTYTPSGPERNLLDKYHASVATPIFRSRKQFLIHILNRPQNSDLRDIITLSKKVSNITAPSNSLTPIGYEAYIDILSIISCVVRFLHVSIATTGQYAGFPELDLNVKYKSTKAVASKAHIVLRNGHWQDTPKDVQGDSAISIDTTGAHIQFREVDTVPHPWGPVSHYTHDEGLSCPFKRDHSTPDVAIFNQFARVFYPVMDKGSVDEDVAGLDEYLEWLEKWWKDEICNTDQGEWLAHLMKICVLCMELGCSIYVCVSAGYYQGCILGGGKWKLQVGKEVYGPSTSRDFELEKEALDVHGSTLDKILDILGTPQPRTRPETMRRLREIAMGTALPSTSKSAINELLPTLSFPATPDPANASTIKDTFRLLSDSSLPIQQATYMAPSSFWTTDRYEEILSRFGTRVPTIQTGSKKYKLCSLAHGQGSSSAVPYSAEPPQLLQFQMVPMAKAVADYKYVYRTGMGDLEVNQELVGSKITLRGVGAKDVWGSITGFVYKKLQQDESQGTGPQGEKRQREDDNDDYEEGEIPSAPKKKKFDPFA